MKHFFTIFALISFLLVGAPALAGDDFVPGFEDIPLMQGLEPDEDMTFDTPEGRIIESLTHSSELTTKEVLSFYADTLPQMGWKKLGKNSFIREEEILTIESKISEGILNVKFFLQPKPDK